MSEVRTRDKILKIERRLLRALCGGAASRSERLGILRRLAAYHWRHPEHQVVFEVLHKLKNASPETVRANLAAELTRKGFPDLDVAVYVVSGETPEEDWLGLVQLLVNSERVAP
jgi:hypothetical protein